MDEGCVVKIYHISEDLKDAERASAKCWTESSQHQKERQFYSHLFFLFLGYSFSLLSHAGHEQKIICG